MNEHDSERIAGLLAADGMEADRRPRDGRRRRAQHLLHPRERRQQALRPPRAAEGAQGPSGPICRSRSAGAWPRRTASSSSSAPATSTSCSAPTTSRTRRALLARAARRGADRRDPRGARGVPVGAARPGATTDTRRGSRSRSAATTRARSASCPSVRGAEVSRRMGDIVHEVEELAADGVRRDHAARPERQLLRPRPRRRPVPPAVRRPAARARRGRRHRAHPVHVAAPEGPPARDDRGDGRVRARVRAPAPAAAVGERPHARAHAPRLHRRALPRAARRRPAPRSPTSRSPPTSSSASPARPTPTSRARSRWSTRPSTTPRTRSCSRPVRAPPRPTMVDDFVAPEVVQERMQRLIEVVERHALAQARGARRAHRGGAGRGPVEEGPDDVVGPHPPEQARALRAGDARRRAPAASSTVAITRAAPHWLRGDARRAGRPAPRRRASASRSTARADRVTAPRARRPDRVGQVGARARRGASARRRRDRLARLDAGVPRAWTSAPPSRRPPSAPRSRTT